MTNHNRTCVDCKHLDFEQELPGYSAMTPGSPMSFGCGVGVWDFSDLRSEQMEKGPYSPSLNITLREALCMGRNCVKFSRVG